jgi:hypothetical protein
MNNMEQFVERLISKVPEAQEIYADHLDDNGALLPHVFMGDITRFAMQIAGRLSEQDVLQRLLLLVEEGLLSDHIDVANFVAVSFIENLCGEERLIKILHPLMGEATRRELKSLCGS